MKKILTWSLLLSMLCSVEAGGLLGFKICAPTTANVMVDSKTAQWLPNVKSELTKSLNTISKAYRLSDSCKNADLKAEYFVSMVSTAPVKGGARAYSVSLSVYDPIMEWHLYHDHIITITSASTTNNTEEVIKSFRELMDKMAATYWEDNS
ncbi:hypothetical protein [Deinococcus deserti]|nr:hypothetical protein [Deinococcus deserti]